MRIPIFRSVLCQHPLTYYSALATLALIVLVQCAAGQTESATVLGRVTDQSGAVVSGVEVEIRNVDTNIAVTSSTNAEGWYAIRSLRPGRYVIVVRKPGFRAVSVTNITLNIQDNLVRNFVLQIGAVSESITVNAESTKINSTDASVSTVIDREFVENLPLNGRSFNTLLQLTPGAVITPTNPSSPGQFSINGQRTNANSFSIDGVSANFGITPSVQLGQSGSGGAPAFNAYGGTSGLVSVDALQEFKVQTSGFAPEYGSTPGGQISIETRSGTNAFHGGLFEYFRNDVLDANDWFADHAGQHKAEERQNDFGGFLGGPILHDKTFLFFSYEGLRLRQPQAKVVSVPSLALRTSAIPQAQPYLEAFPIPNGPVDPANSSLAQLTSVFSNAVALNAASLRLDHTLNKRLTFFGRYSYAPSDSVNRSPLLNNPNAQTVNTATLTLGATALLGSTMTNSFRANYSSQTADSVFSFDPLGGASVLPSSAVLPSPLSSANSLAALNLLDVNSSVLLGTLSANRVTQVNLVDSFSKTTGSHQIKFGVDYRALYLNQGPTDANPNYLVFSTQKFASTATPDIVVSARILPGKVVFPSTSLYGQDSWRVSKTLAITYGLRWQVNSAPSGRDGTHLASWLNTDQPQNIQLAPAGTPPWATTYGNFAPRIGVAYQPTGSADLVLRGGWGIFYDLGTGNASTLLHSFPNIATSIFPGQPLPVANAALITPTISAGPPFSSQTAIYGFSSNLKLPRSQEWNLAIEKQLGAQALSVTYLGQTGAELLRRSGLSHPNPNFTGAGLFILTKNGDSSNYQALQVQMRRPLRKGLQVLLNYAWSHAIDTASSDSVPLQNSDIIIPAQGERGSSSFDVRHNFSGAVAYDLPKINAHPFWRAMANNWSVYGILEDRTGFPIDVTTRGVPIPGLITGTRPDVVPGVPFWLEDPAAPGGQRLNPAAFSVPSVPRQGTLPRNGVPGFAMNQIDLSLGRRFHLAESLNLDFRVDAFNIFNHPSFSNPTGILTSGTFTAANGQAAQMLNQGLSGSGGGISPIYQVGGPRSLQPSLKLTF